jgi:hypothetical protein
MMASDIQEVDGNGQEGWCGLGTGMIKYQRHASISLKQGIKCVLYAPTLSYIVDGVDQSRNYPIPLVHKTHRVIQALR